MPNYLFQNPETGEIAEVFQFMRDEHVHIVDGVSWVRLYTVPQAASNTAKVDPYSSKDFARRTEGKSMTWGNMWDSSRALSEERAQKEGSDPVLTEHFNQYSKNRKGMKHELDTRPQQTFKREIPKKLRKVKKTKT